MQLSPFMKKYLVIPLTLGLTMAPPAESKSIENNRNQIKKISSSLAQGKNPEDYIKYVPGDFLSFMRSNPAWSWAWWAQRVKGTSAVTQQLAQEVGWVSGDGKPDNVDIALANEQVVGLGLVDLDDGGQASLLGDIFHTLVYNEIWPLKLKTSEAMDAYYYGMNNQPMAGMKSLDEVYGFYLDKNPRKSNQKKLKKMKESNRVFLEDLKLVSLEETSREVQELYKQVQSQLDQELSKLGKVLRMGVRIKESGGSALVPRFTMLIENHEELRVIEFKLQKDSAVQASGVSQAPHLERLQNLVVNYRPENNYGAIINFLDTPQGTFIVREKVGAHFDGGEIPSKTLEVENYLEYVRNIFWWLGQKHAQQSSSYAQQWRKNPEAIYKDLIPLVQAHIKHSQELYSRNGGN